MRIILDKQGIGEFAADEINVKEVFFALWSSKILIILMVAIFAVGSVIYSLSIPNKFTSSSLLKMSDNNSQPSSNSSMDMIGSIAGLNLTAAGSSKSSLVIETIESRDFLKHLLTFDKVLPSIVAIQSYDKETGELIFNDSIYDQKNNTFTSDPEKRPTFHKTYLTYNNMINVSTTNTGYIYLSVTHLSPKFAYELLNLIISEVNSLSRARILQESKDSLNFLYNRLTETNEIEIRNSINQIIGSELRRQMLAEVKKNYLINPLDKPFFPEMKSTPNRARICILGTILGFFLSILVSLAKYYGFSSRQYKEL
ncbi:MAG: hypothetical protein CMG16_01520 [Candidatus Marinimicrobia bacterium]|nr:hypothetical protein [Candidatus Neomarinimicrobiota bacterium]